MKGSEIVGSEKMCNIVITFIGIEKEVVIGGNNIIKTC